MWCSSGQCLRSPTFSAIYINDIVKSSKIFKFILFADDTSLYYSTKNPLDIQETVNNELANISDWLSANRLSLNVGKSKLLYFTNNSRNELAKIEIKINNQILAEVSDAKYLGVYIDNKLQWETHINNIKLRLSKGIGILAKIRHYVPSTVLRSLYFTFINSHTDYNLLNWGTAPKSNLDKISSKLRKAIRIINFKQHDEPATPLFKKLSILPLEDTIELKRANFMWKLEHSLIPPSLTDNFKYNQRKQLSIPQNRLAQTASHITYAGPKLWGELPTKIKEKVSPKSFSNALKAHLLKNLI